MSARHYLSYTYFLKWTILNKKYYGSRVANEVEPRKDLLIKYDTSSDPVKRLLKLFGKPDVTCIDKTFTDEQEARDYEYNFLQENNCRLDPTWLNENDRPAPPIMIGKKNPNYGKSINGKKVTIEGKTFNSITEAAKYYNKGHTTIRYWMKIGRIPNKEYTKNLISKIVTGRKHTKEAKQKIRNSSKGKRRNIGKNHPNYGKIAYNRKKVEINGIIYESIKLASQNFKVSSATIRYWIKKEKAKIIN